LNDLAMVYEFLGRGTSVSAEKFVYTAGGCTNEHPAVAQCQARWGSHHFAQEPL
jgi:hypothetical protein